MYSVLIIELSATLQHAVRRLMKAQGYAVSVVRTYEEGLQRLRDAGAMRDYSAVIFGHPLHPHPSANEIHNLLRKPENAKLPVVVLAHDTDTDMLEWISRRARTALLLWDDYTDITGCLAKLLAAPPPPEQAIVGAQNIRILFVDDSRTVRASFRKLLNQHGYDVETAASAAEAMAKAKQHPFDIAIVDYFMPGGNGDVLCRQLRDHPLTADITVALITGTYLEEVIRDSLDAGAIECMFKNRSPATFCGTT